MNIAFKDRVRSCIGGRTKLSFKDFQDELNRGRRLCITTNEIKGHLSKFGYRSDGKGNYVKLEGIS